MVAFYMAWARRDFSKTAINKAGGSLKQLESLSSAEYDRCLEIVNNWRACHNFPLNTFQVGLRRRARLIDRTALVAQRIKRLPSIRRKLEIQGNMTLSQMQDLGGCRAVVRNIAQVKKLTSGYLAGFGNHELARFDDYISAPRVSGYRGIHLIYKYKSEKNAHYNDLRIEMQLRSQMQHIWATAVETVDTFTRQALKSSIGQPDWLRFFALMSSAIAVAEKSPLVPGTPSKSELITELSEVSGRLDVRRRFGAFPAVLQIIEEEAKASDHFFLLVLDPDRGQLDIQSFKQTEAETASAAYLEAEKRVETASPQQVVLVSVNSVAALRRAYPNYFLDSGNFLNLLDSALSGRPMRAPPMPRTPRPKQDAELPPLLRLMLE